MLVIFPRHEIFWHKYKLIDKTEKSSKKYSPSGYSLLLTQRNAARELITIDANPFFLGQSNLILQHVYSSAHYCGSSSILAIHVAIANGKYLTDGHFGGVLSDKAARHGNADINKRQSLPITRIESITLHMTRLMGRHEGCIAPHSRTWQLLSDLPATWSPTSEPIGKKPQATGLVIITSLAHSSKHTLFKFFAHTFCMAVGVGSSSDNEATFTNWSEYTCQWLGLATSQDWLQTCNLQTHNLQWLADFQLVDSS